MGSPSKTPSVLLLDARDRGKLGPCMQKLNDRQRAFVWAMMDTGQVNHKRCAQVAGYQGDDRTLAVTAHRLAHDEDIQAAIQEEARKTMGAAQLVAVSHLVLMASNPAHKDQLSAIKEVLNRSGLNTVTEHKISVTHSTDRDSIVREIAVLAKEQGLDPKKLLGNYGIVIDAEFNEVEDDDLADVL